MAWRISRGNPHSSLARYADLKLVVTPREPTAFRRNLRISARISMLGLVDIIYLALFNSLDDSAFEKIESIFQLYSHVGEPAASTIDKLAPDK